MLDPSEEYRKRLDARLETIATRERQHILLGYLKLAAIAAFIVLVWLYFARHPFNGYWLLAPIGAYAVLASCARAHCPRSYARGNCGQTLSQRVCADGRPLERHGCKRGPVPRLQTRLCGRLGCVRPRLLIRTVSTARMPMGENRLADWLRSPSPVSAVIERQGLIAELRPRLDLREDLAVTGEDLQARLDPESLTKWCGSPPVLGGPVVRAITATFAVVAATCFVYFVHTGNLWPFLAIVVVEAILFRGMRRRAMEVISGVNCNSEGVVLFSQILERLEREPFAAPRLQQFVAELKRGAEPASRSVRRFARIVNWIDAHDSLIVRIIDVPLLYSIQTGLAAEAWRKRCGPQMRTWIDIAGEAEALLSLATYSFEHPPILSPNSWRRMIPPRFSTEKNWAIL